MSTLHNFKERLDIRIVSLRNTPIHQSPKAGMSLVVERPHIKYGSAILIRNDLKVKKIYERVQGTVELITIVMPGVVVHSVYKPPNHPFELPALGHRNLPHFVIGDFNSHITTWGYTNTDNEGEAVEQWADSCNFTFMMLNCRSHSTVRDGRKATTQTSSSHLRASQTCVRSRSWTLSHTHNTTPSVLACNQ